MGNSWEISAAFLYLQLSSRLVDDGKLVIRYPVGIVIRVAPFHDEHAEVVTALLNPIAASILFLTEVQLIADGADALVGPYLPVAVGHETFLQDILDIDHLAIIQQLQESPLAQYGTVTVGKTGSPIHPELLALPILLINNMV